MRLFVVRELELDLFGVLVRELEFHLLGIIVGDLRGELAFHGDAHAAHDLLDEFLLDEGVRFFVREIERVVDGVDLLFVEIRLLHHLADEHLGFSEGEVAPDSHHHRAFHVGLEVGNVLMMIDILVVGLRIEREVKHQCLAAHLHHDIGTASFAEGVRFPGNAGLQREAQAEILYIGIVFFRLVVLDDTRGETAVVADLCDLAVFRELELNFFPFVVLALVHLEFHPFRFFVTDVRALRFGDGALGFFLLHSSLHLFDETFQDEGVRLLVGKLRLVIHEGAFLLRERSSLRNGF